MLMRAQVMFFVAFVIACAMCLASLAAAHGQPAGMAANATLSKAHSSALKHAHALASYVSQRQAAEREIVVRHSDAIGSALQEAAQVSTALAAEVRAEKAKEHVESMREHQADAAHKHKKLSDELALVPLDSDAIRSIARDIAEEVRKAQRDNLSIASIERGARKSSALVE